MPETVRGQALHSRRRGLVGWSIGVGTATIITAAFYPFVAQEPAIRDLMETLPDAILAAMGAAGADFFSPAGYLDARLFGLIAPLLFLIFAIGWATRTLATEEEDGRLELLLTNPVARSRVLLEKAVAVWVGIVLLALVSFVVLLVLRPVSDLTVPVGQLLAMHVSLVLLAGTFGALALAFAAATGRRGLSSGAAAAIAVLAYLVDSFAPLVDGLERVRAVSPFYLYRGNQPLRDGLDPVHALVLLAVAGMLLVVAVVLFERRDIGT